MDGATEADQSGQHEDSRASAVEEEPSDTERLRRPFDDKVCPDDHLSFVPEDVCKPCKTKSVCMTPSALLQNQESNMSEAGYSECSVQSEWTCRRQLTRADALTAKQQVALWLTRTSMSDLSRLPSFKNLVNPHPKWSKVGSKNVTPASMPRNLSTKSLLGSFGFGKGPPPSSRKCGDSPSDMDFQMMPPHNPIRKCETVMTLSTTRPSSARAVSGHPNADHPARAGSAKVRSSCGAKRPPYPQSQHSGGANTPYYGPALSVASEVESPFPGLRPLNRLRSNPSMVCSRCTSVLSINASRMASRNASQLSLLHFRRRESSLLTSTTEENKIEVDVACKICLLEYSAKDVVKLIECHCVFCRECMVQYVSYEVMAGAYEISCPDPECTRNGVVQLSEIEKLVGKDLFDKHRHYRLNTEIALDSNRTWCPQAGCETICHICRSSGGPPAAAVRVHCPNCEKEFCSLCFAAWHPGLSCEENGQAVVKKGGTSASLSANLGSDSTTVIVIDGVEIKRCPMCQVLIERDEGCAQMMCRRCKHVFCWYCLKSLNDDLLLRHYDKGACKGKLGHSRASVFWHRVQAICIVIGFIIILLIASPGLLLIAPCLYYRHLKFYHAKKAGDNQEEDNDDVEDEEEDDDDDDGGGGGGADREKDDGNSAQDVDEKPPSKQLPV